MSLLLSYPFLTKGFILFLVFLNLFFSRVTTDRKEAVEHLLSSRDENALNRKFHLAHFARPVQLFLPAISVANEFKPTSTLSNFNMIHSQENIPP